MYSLNKIIGITYQPLEVFWQGKKVVRLQSILLIISFIFSMGLALINHFSLFILPGIFAHLHFLQSIEISFTLLLFFGTLRINKALQFVFGSLTILFFLLAIGDATKNETITRIAGFEGLICGGSAIYTGIANLLNEVYGYTVLPLGPVRK